MTSATATTPLDWVARYGQADPKAGTAIAGATDGRAMLSVVTEPAGTEACVARERDTGLVFDGFLFDAADLARALEVPGTATDARLVLRAYARWGLDLLRHLRGSFAFVLVDPSRDTLLAARDHLGMHPLFYADTAAGPLFSSNMLRLLREPQVSATVNRVGLAEYLCNRFPSLDETYFEAIRRIPAGSWMVVERGRRRVERYWDPAPPDRPVEWIDEREIGRFDELFERAARRCVNVGRPAIFLSGGLDSISVAAFACDATTSGGRTAPIALSLAFPDPECNEEGIQSGVAAALGIEQVLLPFDRAVGPAGLLRAALATNDDWPFPVHAPWVPAYRHLAACGRERGCETVLTGRGGDEWLTLSGSYAADLMRGLDLAGLWRLINSQRRSYRLALVRSLWLTLAHYGVRPLASAAIDRVAHDWWEARRRRRFVASTPTWVAPDPDLRRALDGRVGLLIQPARPAAGFYARAIRSALVHPLMTEELEESHELARRVGIRMVHPFWDPDLVDLLYRIPPAVLNKGLRAKWLVRDAMERRLPGLGLKRQKKVVSVNFFRSTIHQQGPAVWQDLGGARALTSLDIVRPDEVDSIVGAAFSQAPSRAIGAAWDVMNLETWVRARLETP